MGIKRHKPEKIVTKLRQARCRRTDSALYRSAVLSVWPQRSQRMIASSRSARHLFDRD
jgi:hypothetical protein